MGPATLYWAPFGTTEPAYSAITSPPGVAWTDFGATVDGTSVLLEVDQTYSDVLAEQLVDPIAARLSKRVIQVTATLLEATLQNMQQAMNQNATISPGSGYSVLDTNTAPSASQPQYSALIMDGWAPTTGTTEAECRRRIIVRKCLSSSKVDMEWEKNKPSTYKTSWTAYYVSNSISPFEIVEQTS